MVSDRDESCKEFARRIVRSLTEWRTVRCLNEWRAVRSLLGEL